ncbi:MAG: hypothetical protein ACLTER_08535 [Ruminococcus sp.]
MMKKRKLKVLYILLTVTLAFLIALTGMFVPKLLLNAKAKKLATATGRMDNGDVSPYTYTMDTEDPDCQSRKAGRADIYKWCRYVYKRT